MKHNTVLVGVLSMIVCVCVCVCARLPQHTHTGRELLHTQGFACLPCLLFMLVLLAGVKCTREVEMRYENEPVKVKCVFSRLMLTMAHKSISLSRFLALQISDHLILDGDGYFFLCINFECRIS